MKKLFALALALCLMLCLLAGCGEKDAVLTADEAIMVALKDLGVTAEDVQDAHVHIVEEEQVAYSIHLVLADANYEYVIAANGGKILSVENLGDEALH